MSNLRRIVLHWTGGGAYPNAVDLKSYHALVDQDANRHDGDLAPEANIDISNGVYARHAGQFNTGSIGLALCGMRGAKERPFDMGPSPITSAQFEEAARWAAEFCVTYGIAVSRDTVLIHSEVLPRFGRGIYKWDVNWLPGMAKPGDPVEMGDAFRARVVSHLETIRATKDSTTSEGLWPLILKFLAALFGGKA